MKEWLCIESFGSFLEGTFGNDRHFFCSLNLQHISEVLPKYWEFSVDLNIATHMETAYKKACIHLCKDSAVHDFHLLSIFIVSRNITLNTFNILRNELNADFSDWRRGIVSSSSDGK